MIGGTAIGRSWWKDEIAKVLVIGGTGFVSYFVVEELLSRSHEVIIHRGEHESEHSCKINHIHGNRKQLLGYKDVLLDENFATHQQHILTDTSKIRQMLGKKNTLLKRESSDLWNGNLSILQEII